MQRATNLLHFYSITFIFVLWNGTYSGAVNKHGYSHGAKIFRTMDAIIAKKKRPQRPSPKKNKIVHRIDDSNVYVTLIYMKLSNVIMVSFGLELDIPLVFCISKLSNKYDINIVYANVFI